MHIEITHTRSHPLQVIKKCLQAAFDAAAMIAERAAEDGIELIHSLLWRRLCLCLPFSHGLNPVFHIKNKTTQ